MRINPTGDCRPYRLRLAITASCGSTTASVPLGASHFSSRALAFCAPYGPALPWAAEPPSPKVWASAEAANIAHRPKACNMRL